MIRDVHIVKILYVKHVIILILIKMVYVKFQFKKSKIVFNMKMKKNVRNVNMDIRLKINHALKFNNLIVLKLMIKINV